MVGYGQRGADRALIELQLGGNRLPAGIFDQSRHGGGGQHRQLAAAHGKGGVFSGDTQRCSAP